MDLIISVVGCWRLFGVRSLPLSLSVFGGQPRRLCCRDEVEAITGFKSFSVNCTSLTIFDCLFGGRPLLRLITISKNELPIGIRIESSFHTVCLIVYPEEDRQYVAEAVGI